MAFEIDGYDPDAGEAWSVVVKGYAIEIEQLHQYFDAMDLPLFPWHAGPKHRFVRIEPVEITGRRFHVVGRDAWGDDGPRPDGLPPSKQRSQRTGLLVTQDRDLRPEPA